MQILSRKLYGLGCEVQSGFGADRVGLYGLNCPQFPRQEPNVGIIPAVLAKNQSPSTSKEQYLKTLHLENKPSHYRKPI